MRCAVLWLWVLACLELSLEHASADQRRDWMVAPQPAGTYANLDLIFPGYQAGIEHRHAIYGGANQLTLRAVSLFPLRFHEAQIDADLRLLVLTLGASVGVHDDLRLIAFAPGEATDSEARADRQDAGAYTHERWPYFEGRLTLSLPFNQHLLFQNVNTYRYETRPTPSFDWRNGFVHDRSFLRSDLQLVFKHRDWGAIGPMVQVLVFTLADVAHTQINYGFVFASRPGILRRNDLVFLQILYHFGGALSPYDNRDGYGGLAFLGPLTFILAYRATLKLGD